MPNVTHYVQPESLEEALELMASGELAPVAGGTDLMVQLRHGGPGRLVDITGLGLSFVRVEGGIVEIGACVTHSSLAHHSALRTDVKLLSMAAASVGTEQIRNRGTIGGNLVNASPSADTVPALLNHDAELVLLSRNGTRSVQLSEFISGPYLSERRPDELLHSIRCTKGVARARTSFIKVKRRAAVNISRMTVALYAEMQEDGTARDVRLSAGAAFPIACRIADVEAMVRGNRYSEKLCKEAGALASRLMVKRTGVRWSTPYKEPVLAGLVERALREVMAGRVK